MVAVLFYPQSIRRLRHVFDRYTSATEGKDEVNYRKKGCNIFGCSPFLSLIHTAATVYIR